MNSSSRSRLSTVKVIGFSKVIVMYDTRICTKCGKLKDNTEFSPDSRKLSGVSSACRACHSKTCEKYRKKNSEKVRTASSRWKDRNKESVLANLKKWRKKNPMKVFLQRSRNSAKRHGYLPCLATVEELEAIVTGRCAICEISEKDFSGKFHMDHDHATGKLRGWLCSKCNQMLGMANDNVVILAKAMAYLKTNN